MNKFHFLCTFIVACKYFTSLWFVIKICVTLNSLQEPLFAHFELSKLVAKQAENWVNYHNYLKLEKTIDSAYEKR